MTANLAHKVKAIVAELAATKEELGGAPMPSVIALHPDPEALKKKIRYGAWIGASRTAMRELVLLLTHSEGRAVATDAALEKIDTMIPGMVDQRAIGMLEDIDALDPDARFADDDARRFIEDSFVCLIDLYVKEGA